MPDLVHCIYSSVQTHVLAPSEIDALLRHSRRSNQTHNITGILLHVGRTFFQVLEGPPHEVDELYRKILADTRHTKIAQIIYEPIARRFFGDSTMSLATLTAQELAMALDEPSAERVEELLAGMDEGRAKRLLRAFSQGRWRARVEAQIADQVSLT